MWGGGLIGTRIFNELQAKGIQDFQAIVLYRFLELNFGTIKTFKTKDS